MDTSFSYCNNKAYFSSDERKWITKITNLAKEYPNEVTIIASPENNDGCIYVQLPAEWLKIQPKHKLNLTEEQRQAARERMAKLRMNA